METLGNQIMPKLCAKFYCNYCAYETSKKSSYDNHNLSLKHNKMVNGNKIETTGNEIMPKLCLTNLHKYDNIWLSLGGYISTTHMRNLEVIFISQ